MPARTKTNGTNMHVNIDYFINQKLLKSQRKTRKLPFLNFMKI